VTESPGEVPQHIDAASAAGITHVIAIGGDGTNHAVINALAERPCLDNMTFGSVPVGTGRDWARTLGIPGDPRAAVDWLGRAQPVPCDLGRMECLDAEHTDRAYTRMFLNVASAGVSGEIDRCVNRARRRTCITFLRSTITTLLRYKPQRISVKCDKAVFYSDAAYLLAVANGRYFGRGMFIAPSAVIDDGLFEVVLVEEMPRRRILLALPQVFSGEHVRRDDVHCTRAAVVEVHSDDGPLALDLDGEEAQGQDLRFTMLPAAVNILMHPGDH
jgi:YegS/Rv2252/BmrU family lipid kinase